MSEYLSLCCVKLVEVKRIQHFVRQPSLWKFRVYVSIIFSTWCTFLWYVQISNWLPAVFWSLCNIGINQRTIFSQDCSACSSAALPCAPSLNIAQAEKNNNSFYLFFKTCFSWRKLGMKVGRHIHYQNECRTGKRFPEKRRHIGNYLAIKQQSIRTHSVT